MGTFPSSDADILLLASEMVSGLIINPLVYPAPPVTPAQLSSAKTAFEVSIQDSLTAHSAAEAATDAKDAQEVILTKMMKKIVGYAETTVGNDDTKLNLIGLTGRKAPTPLAAPGQVTLFAAKEQGEGTITFGWKSPEVGGKVASYCIERRELPGGPWQIVGVATAKESTLNNQTRGKELEYRVCGINSAGQGPVSNVVEAVL